jgi:hypothetical protein
MTIHVSIDEPAERVHVDGAAVQPMIGDIVGQARCWMSPVMTCCRAKIHLPETI